MVGTRIPKDILKESKEEGGYEYILKSETFPANEPWDIPDESTTFDIVLSKNPRDKRDWFDVIYLLPLQKTEETMETNCVCRSEVISVNEVCHLPQKSQICDFNRTYSSSLDEYKYRVTYFIPRPEPEKPENPLGVFEWL